MRPTAGSGHIATNGTKNADALATLERMEPPMRRCVLGHDRERAGAMEEPRKLYRSQTQRKLAGVCGGLAEYFNIDATALRVLFLILAVFGGSGLVIYLVMWIIVPNASKA
jgi:phage shock protein C